MGGGYGGAKKPTSGGWANKPPAAIGNKKPAVPKQSGVGNA